LVWDFRIGAFSAAPILFIDHDARREVEVVRLTFSDSTYVKIIDSHGFFNTTLNRYVRILAYNAYQFVGHEFLQHVFDSGELIMNRVTLVDIDVFAYYTAAWNPITANSLAFFANGMLSAPGIFMRTGFLNIFEVCAKTLQYCPEIYATFIATYGLLSFDEFKILVTPDFTKEMFYAFNGQYLAISVALHNTTWEAVATLIKTFSSLLA